MTARLHGPPSRRALLVLHFAALWPVLLWLWSRVTDGSGEGWGLAVWGLAAVVVATRSRPRDMPVDLLLPALTLAAYAALYPFSPPLLSALLGAASVSATLSALYLGHRASAPLCALLLLGLPVEASLQFYLGYPLRFVVAAISAPMLGLAGFDVVAEGTLLASTTTQVAVDGPCSGVKMLRLALALSCFLALMRNSGVLVWLRHLALSAAALVVANALRSSSLYIVHVTSYESASVHAGVGMAAFALLLLFQVVLFRRSGWPWPRRAGSTP